jgi:hypothetical protein
MPVNLSQAALVSLEELTMWTMMLIVLTVPLMKWIWSRLREMVDRLYVKKLAQVTRKRERGIRFGVDELTEPRNAYSN